MSRTCAGNQFLRLREGRCKRLLNDHVPARRNRLPCVVKMHAVNNAEIDEVCPMCRKHRSVVRRHLRNTELLRKCPRLLPALWTCTDRDNLNPLYLLQGDKRLARNHPCTNNCYLHCPLLLHVRTSYPRTPILPTYYSRVFRQRKEPTAEVKPFRGRL